MNRHLDELCRRVADPFYLEPCDLFASEDGYLFKNATAARRVAMWLIWATWFPRPSTTEIARMFGFKNPRSSHNTVRTAVTFVEEQIKLKTDVGQIAERLRKPASVPPPKLRVVG